MSTKGKNDDSKNSDNMENTCVVCFKNVDIYSIGECDHPVCYECSTRMRVLCQQNECPICRQGLSKVIFTTEKRSYRDLETSNRSEYYNKKYKICFSNLQIQKAFYNLLDHPCPKCNCRPFHSFDALKEHVRKEHEMFYCDLCTEHLKIFSFERKCYTRQELGMHRRIGDPDNTSHKGHPLCQYCDCRYLDRDELFRHLRREHYFCHFCDADGANQFYGDLETLRDHFRAEHFLCEEGDCVREQFTAVFRTEIDLKAHIANVHGKSLGKLQAKQARTLQLDITLGPRNRLNQPEQAFANLRSRGNEEFCEMEPIRPLSDTNRNPPKIIDARNEQEFPSLGGVTASSSTVTLIRPTMSIRAKSSGPGGLARTKENFPALAGGGGGDDLNSAGNNHKNNQPPVSALLKNTPSSQYKPNSGSVVIHVSNRPNSSNNLINSSVNGDSKKPPYEKLFPALPGSSKTTQNIREDFISGNSINLNVVAAKHRHLVDDYVSPTNNHNNSKITIVQKESTKSTKKEHEAPKLTNSDFPALASSIPTPEVSWVKPPKQQELENRKSKIAPAPLIKGTESTSKKAQDKKEVVKQNKINLDTENNNPNKKSKKSSKLNDRKVPDSKNDTFTVKSADNKQSNKEKKSDSNENKNESKGCDKAENNLLNDLEFPKLGTSNAVPPGFGAKKPPPGFQNVTLQSVAKPRNNLTFTSSLGESYSIVPSHKYIPPPNSVKRNQELVTHFQNALESLEAVEEFRYISQRFRDGQYKTNAYYEHCQAALKDKFDEIFPELLILLPDINKQQELYLVHSQHMKDNLNNRKRPRIKLEVCSICKQVLKTNDMKAHTKSHNMENNFPSLQDLDNLISFDVKK